MQEQLIINLKLFNYVSYEAIYLTLTASLLLCLNFQRLTVTYQKVDCHEFFGLNF